jgi:hypothetical protein
MDSNVQIISRTEIYDDMGFVLPPHATEGYDINGFPVCRYVGAVIDGKVVITGG